MLAVSYTSVNKMVFGVERNGNERTLEIGSVL
jgi:hypothetical protein